MIKTIKLIIPIFLLLALFACKKEQDVINVEPASRYSIPLNILYSQSKVTASIQININGEIRDVLFDTGSFGLRIMRPAIGNVQAVGPRLTYPYGAVGDQMMTVGTLDGGYFSLGMSSGNISIRFMAIDSVTHFGKNDLHPFPAGEITDSAFRNLSGILGVGLRYDNTGAANPIAQLPGTGKYIVEFPSFGNKQGAVIINPHVTDTKGFTYFKLAKGEYLIPNGDNSWLDNQLSGFITYNSIRDTSGILLDSGTSPISITTDQFASGEIQNGDISYGLTQNGNQSESISNSFEVENPITLGKNLAVVSTVPKNGIARTVLGTQTFFTFDVLYDQVNGLIGLRKK
ncbi:hypothetical protein HDF19_00725 [Mucilaginibacter sp. E4BP6]|uniref:hypothetical protein n=1 Tax=Mucilaginibacter sp. E4BP6 TaxID=2723089 RepID=UPI0015CA6013|nr:hypothetical protein [Mucilaginibacter sp. E4BP6]NYE66897.1 hypothetical protein [Mucilaginibacter sp. E4BP6]